MYISGIAIHLKKKAQYVCTILMELHMSQSGMLSWSVLSDYLPPYTPLACPGFLFAESVQSIYTSILSSLYSEGYMYWSDVLNGSLNRAFLNGTNPEVLLYTDDPVIGESYMLIEALSYLMQMINGSFTCA